MNWSADEVALVPLPVVTVTSTVPEPAGAVAVIDVVLLMVKPVAFAPPNRTAVAPVKPVPLIVIAVPPPPGPDVGDMDATVGPLLGAGSTITVTLITRVVLPLSTVNVSMPEKPADGGR